MDYASLLGIETPLTILRPRTQEEAAAFVAEAASAGKAVIPWGGGTAQTYGYTPARADILLDVSGMNRVIAHEPGDLTVTVEPGVTLDDLQEVLSRHNQFLPLDPAHGRTATVGGILATNAFGAGSAGYGTPRDWLIGLTVVNAQGKAIHGGGKVVKNVTGYDLPKLHVGALGTLGVIVEATFKVAPRPDASRPVLFVLPPAEGAGDIAPALRERILAETSPAFALLREESDSRALILLYNGPEEVVAYEAQRAAEIGNELRVAPAAALPPGMSRPFTEIRAAAEAHLIARIAGPPAAACGRHAALSGMGFWALLDTLPATGHTDAYLRPNTDPEAAARDILTWANAHGNTSIAFTHAPLALRRDRTFPLWSPPPSTLPIMRRMKETLDPAGTLNPGRFVGGL